MKTFMAKNEDIERAWHVVDAKGQTLGRLASEAAALLRGKHKPSFTPHVDCGDHVIIINAKDIELSGKKWQDKKYYRHSQHPGSLKVRTAADMKEKQPCHMVELAVKGMLPKGSLGRQMFKKLHVYENEDHPHQAQQPKQYELEG